jgi:hypothetical protein
VNLLFLHFRRRAYLILFIASVALVAAHPLSGQEETAAEIRARLARTGVFFRADTPAALRNPHDPYLPIFLEVINGVEQEAHTTGSSLKQYIPREPLRLEGVNVFAKPAGARRQFAGEPLRLGASHDYSFDPRTNGQALEITHRMKKTLEVPLKDLDAYLAKHYLGGPFKIVDLRVAFRAVGWPSQDFYLRVQLQAPPLPRLAGWYRGDPHYHCAFTDNPAERGYPLGVTKQAALQAGFDWVMLADHSTDLDAERYAEELREVRQYRDGRFLFIRGEEVTTASGQEGFLTTIHLLALPSPDDPDKGFPDPAHAADVVIQGGDGSVTSPAPPLKNVLARIAAAGGFAYAAHPFDPLSPVMRGGSWDLDTDFLAPGGTQLAPGLVGLEAWNRATSVTADDPRDPFCIRRGANPSACFQPDKEADQYVRLEKAIEIGWRPLLQKGLAATGSSASGPRFKAFLAAGSDAHGDFNYEATMDVTDFVFKPSRALTGYAEDNALGKISTVVFAPAGMGTRGEQVLRALRDGHSAMSNGPLLVAGFDRNSNGTLHDPADVVVGGEIASTLAELPPLEIEWVSSEEFGPLESIRLIVGTATGEAKPEEIPVPPAKGLASGGLVSVDLRPFLGKNQGAWSYLRLEARSRNFAGREFRCYTNPIWVRITGE